MYVRVLCVCDVRVLLWWVMGVFVLVCVHIFVCMHVRGRGVGLSVCMRVFFQGGFGCVVVSVWVCGCACTCMCVMYVV